MSILFLFVDGLGLGDHVPGNPVTGLLDDILDVPLARDHVPADFSNAIIRPLDTTGGIPGIPQSASGQASLVTGRNIPAFLGYHLTAMPNDKLADLILQDNVMKELQSLGARVTASNMYTQEFFSWKEELFKKRGHNVYPVSTLTNMSTGVPFRNREDYESGMAVFSDLTNRFLKERGVDIELVEPEQAALNMANILSVSDFVYHEYFATDTYAHKKRQEDLERACMEINRFLKTLADNLDFSENTLVIVSDHGNCEDPGSADHNRNPVPLIVLSQNRSVLDRFGRVRALEEVRGAIVDSYSGQI